MNTIVLDLAPVPFAQHKEIHIAVDFDGTLAQYTTWDNQFNKVGPPVQRMVNLIKQWLAKGYKVTIFTARLSHSSIESEQSIAAIRKFLLENGLPNLPVTCMKMHYFTHVVDDRAFHCEKNTGVISPELNFNIEE